MEIPAAWKTLAGYAQPGASRRIADRLVAARAVADFAYGFCAASSVRYALIVN
jgi:hypothetical protein